MVGQIKEMVSTLGHESKVDFPVDKITTIKELKHSDKKLVSNTLIFGVNEYRNDYQNRFSQCLIVMQSKQDSIEILKDPNLNVYIHTSNPLKVYEIFVNKFGVNEPLLLDENKLKHHENFKEMYFTERMLCEELPQIGKFTQIGKSGQYTYLEDEVPHEVLNIGHVEIGKNVIIGNNVTIYRGLIGATRIKDNVIIGDNVVILPDTIVTTNIKSNNTYGQGHKGF